MKKLIFSFLCILLCLGCMTEKTQAAETLHMEDEGEAALLGPGAVCARNIGISMGNQATDVGRIEYQFNDTMLADTTVLDGKVSIVVNSIQYRLKMDVGRDKIQVEDFYIAVDQRIEVSADFKVKQNSVISSGIIPLGSVPFVLGQTGVSGSLTFYLTYDANGNVNVDYALVNTTGIAYENNSYQPFAENRHAFAAYAGADAKVGPKMQVILYYGRGTKLLDITVHTGLAGNANVKAESLTQMPSAEIETYVYMKLSRGDGALINRLFDWKEKELWDYKTSPYRKTIG